MDISDNSARIAYVVETAFCESSFVRSVLKFYGPHGTRCFLSLSFSVRAVRKPCNIQLTSAFTTERRTNERPIYEVAVDGPCAVCSGRGAGRNGQSLPQSMVRFSFGDCREHSPRVCSASLSRGRLASTAVSHTSAKSWMITVQTSLPGRAGVLIGEYPTGTLALRRRIGGGVGGPRRTVSSG